MYCRSCGKQLPDDSTFCQFCGVEIEQVFIGIEGKPEKQKRKKSPLRVVAIILAVILGVCLIGGGVLFHQVYTAYEAACDAVLDCKFEKAEALLLLPELVLEYDADLAECIQYGKKFEDGHIHFAYHRLKNAAQDGNTYAKSVLSDLTKKAYNEAVSLYKQKNYVDAKLIFDEIASHKDSRHYSLLCEVYMNKNWTEEQYYSYLRQLDFEELKDIVLNEIDRAQLYLKGTWKTGDGRYYFKMKDDGHINYNLPWVDHDDSYYYTIEDGMLYVYQEDRPKIHKNLFKFTAVDESTVRVYCYKNGSTYTLYKQ